MRISKGGQISLPSTVRQRWTTGFVTIEDRGDTLLVRPAPNDPIEAAAGSLADIPGPLASEAIAQFRADEIAAEQDE